MLLRKSENKRAYPSYYKRKSALHSTCFTTNVLYNSITRNGGLKYRKVATWMIEFSRKNMRYNKGPLFINFQFYWFSFFLKFFNYSELHKRISKIKDGILHKINIPSLVKLCCIEFLLRHWQCRNILDYSNVQHKIFKWHTDRKELEPTCLL